MSATLPPYITAAAPTSESLSSGYGRVERLLDEATDPESVAGAIAAWDQLRRQLRTWKALVQLRFRQNTTDARAREERALADSLEPQLLAHDTRMKRRLLEHRLASEMQQRFGAQAFRLWEADLKSYAPAIDEDLVAESGLVAEYTELFGSITVEFDGRRMTLPEVRGYLNHRVREVRHAAEKARWVAIGERGQELDRIYAQMVLLRDRIAKALGAGSFVPVAYARMQRVDYGPGDVERWRDAVATDVVPLACKIMQASAKRFGHPIMAWDESVLVDGEANPTVDGAAIVAGLPDVLGTIDSRLGSFGAFMRDNGFLDVFAREGKGPGGFCTSFPTEGHPFIFASFNGTKDDVKVLVHEMGHAFQSYLSRDLALEDYLTPTSEAAEIDSMGLEFLSWPGLEQYFGDRADAFRSEHLASALLFLPYGCAVDHFQHLVYAQPEATPGERRAMWQQMEKRYLPWRSFGDVEYPGRGNYWQAQLHIYNYPFYYIDYTLAQCCALQFWAQAQRNRKDTVERYVQLCARGGSASFRELVGSAGLESPFDGSALKLVVEEARRYLAAAGLV